MSIYEFEIRLNGTQVKGLFNPTEVRHTIFPTGTISRQGNDVVIDTGLSYKTLPLRVIGDTPLALDIRGTYPLANGPTEGVGKFVIKKWQPWG